MDQGSWGLSQVITAKWGYTFTSIDPRTFLAKLEFIPVGEHQQNLTGRCGVH